MSGYFARHAAQAVFSPSGSSGSFVPRSGPPMASDDINDHQESVWRSRITREAFSRAPDGSSSSVRPFTVRP